VRVIGIVLEGVTGVMGVMGEEGTDEGDSSTGRGGRGGDEGAMVGSWLLVMTAGGVVTGWRVCVLFVEGKKKGQQVVGVSRKRERESE